MLNTPTAGNPTFIKPHRMHFRRCGMTPATHAEHARTDYFLVPRYWASDVSAEVGSEGSLVSTLNVWGVFQFRVRGRY